MPIGFLERMAKQKNIPLGKAEDIWGRAKGIARKNLGIGEGESHPELETLTTGIFFNLVGASGPPTSESKTHNRSERLKKKLDKARAEDADKGSFTEEAPEWWQKMSHKQQMAYLEEHPNSQMSQQLDEHIQKSVDKKTKDGGLSDKEKEIAGKHYEAKEREKNGPPDDDELVDGKTRDASKKDKTEVSLEEPASDEQPKPEKTDQAPAEDKEDDELVDPPEPKAKKKKAKDEDDNAWDEYADGDSDSDPDIPALDSEENKKTRSILKGADAKKMKSLLTGVQEDPSSPFAKRMRRYLDAKDNEGEELTKDEREFKKALAKKKATKKDRYGYDSDDGDDESGAHAKSEKALKTIFDDDQSHDDRLTDLQGDPNSSKAKRLDKYLAERRKAGALTEKEKELAKAREDGLKTVDMNDSEKKAFLLDKKAQRAKDLGRNQGEGKALLKELNDEVKELSKADKDAWVKLQKVKPKKPSKKERGIWANLMKAKRDTIASKLADPEHAFHSLAKLKSGDTLTDLDKTNVKRAMLKVGGAVLMTGMLAGLAFFAAPMLPGLIESYFEYKSQHAGNDSYSVFSSDQDKKPTKDEQNKLIGDMAEDFSTWLADQDPTKFS